MVGKKYKLIRIINNIIICKFEVVEIGQIEKLDRYEYSSPVKLGIISGNYFVVPSAIILAKDIDIKRIMIFSYFSVHRGLNGNVLFSLNHILQWIGKQSDRHKNGINEKIMRAIHYLQAENYISDCDLDSSYANIQFNLFKIQQECEIDRFAVIYLDELQLLMNYTKQDKDAYFNNDVILLVFLYLRMKIYRRRNQLLPEDNNIALRKINNPEVYNCYQYDIAKDLGISTRVVSKTIKTLFELGLIYFEELPRTKYNIDKWHTNFTLFCNVYKREGNYQLASGEQYYLAEIKNKRQKLGF